MFKQTVSLLCCFTLAFLIFLPAIKAQPFTTLDSIQASMKMENIEASFLGLNHYFLSKKLNKAPIPFHFPRKTSVSLPTQFKHDGDTYNTTTFIDSSDTQGFLIVQNDSISFEQYWRGQKEDSNHIAWSMSKSYISAFGDEKEIMAVGVFNQYIYINPTTETVIVKNSANKNYYDGSNPYRDTQVHLELFRAIAKKGE